MFIQEFHKNIVTSGHTGQLRLRCYSGQRRQGSRISKKKQAIQKYRQKSKHVVNRLLPDHTETTGHRGVSNKQIQLDFCLSATEFIVAKVTMLSKVPFLKQVFLSKFFFRQVKGEVEKLFLNSLDFNYFQFKIIRMLGWHILERLILDPHCFNSGAFICIKQSFCFEREPFKRCIQEYREERFRCSWRMER